MFITILHVFLTFGTLKTKIRKWTTIKTKTLSNKHVIHNYILRYILGLHIKFLLIRGKTDAISKAPR